MQTTVTQTVCRKVVLILVQTGNRPGQTASRQDWKGWPASRKGKGVSLMVIRLVLITRKELFVIVNILISYLTFEYLYYNLAIYKNVLHEIME